MASVVSWSNVDLLFGVGEDRRNKTWMRKVRTRFEMEKNQRDTWKGVFQTFIFNGLIRDHKSLPARPRQNATEWARKKGIHGWRGSNNFNNHPRNSFGFQEREKKLVFLWKHSWNTLYLNTIFKCFDALSRKMALCLEALIITMPFTVLLLPFHETTFGRPTYIANKEALKGHKQF